MTTTNERPARKETVGAQYVCFATSGENGEFTGTYAEDVECTKVVKTISVTENADSTDVYGSGEIYDTEGKTSSVEISSEVLGFVDKTVHKMRGDTIDASGLVLKGGNNDKPYFAYGKVVKLSGGKARWEWYPKCKLTAKTDDISTSEDSYSEQNDTLTIMAYPFDEDGNISTEATNDIEGLTEDKFFSKPILKAADLTSVIAK